MPLVRKIASAFARSPALSTSARLQSIKPAFVFSRNCLTSFGSISVVVFIEVSSEVFRALRREGRTQLLRRDASHLDLLTDARFVSCRNDRVYQFLQDHPNGTNCVIVASDRVINDVGIGIGIHNRDYWNSEAARLINRVLLADCVDHY